MPLRVRFRSAARRGRLIWLAASYVLVSTFLPVTNMLAATPLHLSQSSLLAGALVLLLLLHTRCKEATLFVDPSAGCGSRDPNRTGGRFDTPRISM